jgi:hypothetical protein
MPVHSDDGQCRDVFWRIAAAPPPSPAPRPLPPPPTRLLRPLNDDYDEDYCSEVSRLPAVSHTSELRVHGWAPYKQMHPRAGVGTGHQSG